MGPHDLPTELHLTQLHSISPRLHLLQSSLSPLLIFSLRPPHKEVLEDFWCFTVACLYFFSPTDTFIKLNSPDKEQTVEEEAATFRPLHRVSNTPWKSMPGMSLRGWLTTCTVVRKNSRTKRSGSILRSHTTMEICYSRVDSRRSCTISNLQGNSAHFQSIVQIYLHSLGVQTYCAGP